MSEKKKRYEIIEENDKTIKILFFDSYKTEEYKIITKDDIKLMLETNQDINLKGCYIKDFSYLYVCGIPSNYNLDEIKHNRKILNNFNASNAFFDGDVDFSYAQFGDGDVNFSDAQFGDGNVYFFMALFGDGNVYFPNAQFGDGNVDFCDAQFGDSNVFFSGTQFGNGDVIFSDTQFGCGVVNFFDTKFGDGDVDFSDAQFGNGDVVFSYAKFGHGVVDFSDAQFGNGDVDFSNAQFVDGNMMFIKVQFGKGDVDFSDAFFGKGLFIFQNINNIEQLNFKISLAIDTFFFFDSCYFSFPVFINIDPIKYIIFNLCTFSNLLSFDSSYNGVFTDKQIALFNMTNMGTIKLDWEKAKYSIIKFNPEEALKNDKNLPKTSVRLLSSITDKKKLNKLKYEELSLIKENYHNQGRYDWEDDVYVEFKKRATIFDKNRLSIKHPLKSLYYLISFVIYKAMYPVGKFGTDPLSILGTMILTVLLFGGIFYLPFVDIQSVYSWNGFYYSAITFFTIGYGDLSAHNIWAAVFSGLEGFLGVFLMGYFSVAVVRKILR